jgi:hypothetical protein
VLFHVLLKRKIGDPVVIQINANQTSVRDNPHIRGGVDDLRFGRLFKHSAPTPAALAANAYMLSCWWIDSERFVVLRGRGFTEPPQVVYYLFLLSDGQAAIFSTAAIFSNDVTRSLIEGF